MIVFGETTLFQQTIGHDSVRNAFKPFLIFVVSLQEYFVFPLHFNTNKVWLIWLIYNHTPHDSPFLPSPPLMAGDPSTPEPSAVLGLGGFQHRLWDGELQPGHVGGGSQESQRQRLHRIAGPEIRHRYIAPPCLHLWFHIFLLLLILFSPSAYVQYVHTARYSLSN